MVSVCIATYNGEKYIKDQIDSILLQLGDDDEIIVSDDYSDDRTLTILYEVCDSRIKIFKNDRERSVVANFENALLKASGDYIFLSDQDDVWFPNKVEIMLHEMKDVDLVVSDCYVVNGNFEIVNDSIFSVYRSKEGVVRNFIKNTYLGNCMAFRKSVLERVLPFPPELHKLKKFYVYHDVWIGLLANIAFKVKFLPQRLSYFRRHDNNVSPTETIMKSPNSFLDKLVSRLLLGTAIMLRMIAVSTRNHP